MAKDNAPTARRVLLKGLRPIMFDRYAGDNNTELEVHQKFYYGRDGKTLVLPAANVSSFLSAQNTDSAAKRLLPTKEYKKMAGAILAYSIINPDLIPIRRNGEPIQFDGTFDDEADGERGVYVHCGVARLPKGIPNFKIRPVVDLPWELEFEYTLIENPEVQETTVLRLFKDGGVLIGLGTYRGLFGKFTVECWE